MDDAFQPRNYSADFRNSCLLSNRDDRRYCHWRRNRSTRCDRETDETSSEDSIPCERSNACDPCDETCCCSNDCSCMSDCPPPGSSLVSAWAPCVVAMFLILLTLALTQKHCFQKNSTLLSSSSANLALTSLGSTIEAFAKGVSCAPKNRENDPRVIISGMPLIPGHAFCYEGNAEFVICLSTPTYVQGISYEHIAREAHPEKHIKSAPMLFLVYGLNSDEDDEEGTFLGSAEYLDNGITHQTTYFQKHVSSKKFNKVKVAVFGNHGMHFTCIYRIHIHGKIN